MFGWCKYNNQHDIIKAVIMEIFYCENTNFIKLIDNNNENNIIL